MRSDIRRQAGFTILEIVIVFILLAGQAELPQVAMRERLESSNGPRYQ